LIRNLRVAEGLNTITRRGEIGTGTLVLGLRARLALAQLSLLAASGNDFDGVKA